MTKFERDVSALVDILQGWLVNLQRNEYAQNNIILPEVIAQAFEDLRERYEILYEEADDDDLINKLLGNDNDE